MRPAAQKVMSDMKLEWNSPRHCDVLVVGAGLAGLRAAIDLANAGLQVLVAARSSLAGGSSFYPFTDGLGCQLPDSDADAEAFLAEVLDAGAGMASEELYRLQIGSIRHEVSRLDALGITPYYIKGRAACFAKRERTICAWDGWDEIRARLHSALALRGNLAFLPHTDAVQLLTNRGAVCGAVLLGPDGALQQVNTPAVILATGGPCGLYRHSLNPPDVTGSAAALALDAGASLVNFEFLQFIPGLMQPLYKMLFCEISLWHCTGVTAPNGSPLLEAALPAGVSVQDCLQARSMHAPFTVRDQSRWFDLAMMQGILASGRPEGCRLAFAESFGTDGNEFVASARSLYLKNGIDLTKQTISIAPFAHCANGGVRIDADAATDVPGLYCAGEAAGGIHGADRHGGVATAAALVFGARAAAAAAAYSKAAPCHALDESTVHADFVHRLRCAAPDAALAAKQVRDTVADSLWLHANVLRTAAGLGQLSSVLTDLACRYSPLEDAAAGAPLQKALQAHHGLRTAAALAAAMTARTESRGGHCRADCPATDPAQAARLLVTQKDGAPCAAWEETT